MCGKCSSCSVKRPEAADTDAATVIALETELAQASRTRVELRDPDKNYNKFTGRELAAGTPAIVWNVYFAERGICRTRL